MENEKMLRRVLGSKCPKIIQQFSKTLEQIDIAANENCVDLSREREKHYLYSHIQSARNNLRLIEMGLSVYLSVNSDLASVLDIGASPLTFFYRQSLKGKIATIDLTSLLKARCAQAGIIHKQCNLIYDNFPFETNEFDVCVFTEVMEHLPIGPRKIFCEIRRILKDNSLLLFSLPNSAKLRNRILALLGCPLLAPVYDVFKEDVGDFSSGQGTWVHGFGHIREYTMAETINIVKHYGFEPLAWQSLDPCLILPGESGYRCVLRQLKNVIARILPNSSGINLVLCRKINEWKV